MRDIFRISSSSPSFSKQFQKIDPFKFFLPKIVRLSKYLREKWQF